MNDHITTPAWQDLTATEKRLFRAVTTRVYGDTVSRQGDVTLEFIVNTASPAHNVAQFLGYSDFGPALTWAMMVVAHLTENRVEVPVQPTPVQSWPEVAAEVRRLVAKVYDAELQDQQEFLEDDPTAFAQFHSDSVVVDGKVTDPWGPAITIPLNWWLDNMTLAGVWLAYLAIASAVAECVSDNLALWAADLDDVESPRKVARKAFEDGMATLRKDIAWLQRNAA